ncbi:MAG: superoxide dismutase [Candidatus Pacebacteria bacterium]|nr:superoxide dismutase [Candidatus Paceibacterota bacterium]
MKTNNRFYTFPQLKFEYDQLWPFITEEQLRLHHQKHHRSYVENTNQLLKQLEKTRANGGQNNIKSLTRALSFNLGGHLLHSLFWENLTPAKQQKPINKKLEKALIKEFDSLDEFKSEFEQAANSVEGSGWAALAYSPETKRLLITQIEKHNVNLYPGLELLLVLDVWEHAYYVDYRNERSRFVTAFWEIVDWAKVAQRLK